MRVFYVLVAMNALYDPLILEFTMKPLMPPALLPRSLPSSARSGSQSSIVEKIITEARHIYVQNSFEHIESSTRLAIESGNDPSSVPKASTDLFKKISTQREDLYKQRDQELERRRACTEEDFVDNPKYAQKADSCSLKAGLECLISLIKRSKVANCGELAYYFQHLLYEVGLPTIRISIKVQNQAKSRVCSDHDILVAGLDPSANVFDPHTYKHAPALDVWWLTEKEKGLFLPMQEYIEKLKQTFQLDEQAGEYLSFEPSDYYCNDDNGYPFPKFATVPELPSEFRNP